MSLFTDRRPLRQIGGLRAYLVQVGWSLRWRLRRRPRAAGMRRPEPSRSAKPAAQARLGRRPRPAERR